jgi:hypothetical protein
LRVRQPRSSRPVVLPDCRSPYGSWNRVTPSRGSRARGREQPHAEADSVGDLLAHRRSGHHGGLTVAGHRKTLNCRALPFNR